MANIEIQRLDRHITILNKTSHRNEYFEYVEDWVEERKVWCSVKQQFFKDYQETFGTVLENTTNFIVRYDTGKFFDNTKRIVFQGRTYEIINILEGSFDRDFTTIVAKQVKE